jgi:hypothetical protein
MRIRIIQRPSVPCIDGVQLDHLYPGRQCDLEEPLGALFIAEGWGVLDSPAEEAALPPNVEPDRRRYDRKVVSVVFPPRYHGPRIVDRRRTPTAGVNGNHRNGNHGHNGNHGQNGSG